MRCFSPRSIRSHSRGVDDPRHDVERPDLFGAGLVAIDVERDAHVQQGQVGRLLAALQFAVGERHQAAGQQLGPRAGASVRLEHLVVEAAGLIGIESHRFHPCRPPRPSAHARIARQSGRHRPRIRHIRPPIATIGTFGDLTQTLCPRNRGLKSRGLPRAHPTPVQSGRRDRVTAPRASARFAASRRRPGRGRCAASTGPCCRPGGPGSTR